MGEEEDIHIEPESTGVKPVQQETPGHTGIIVIDEGVPSGKIMPQSFSEALREARNVGGTALAFLQIQTQHFESEVKRLREERDLARGDSDKWKDAYHRTRYDNLKRLNRRNNIMIAIGILMFSLSGKFALEGQSWAFVGLILGATLLLTGWFLPREGKED
jgi:hypothetical protein